MIHATAIVHPAARLDSTVEVGPFAIIDAGVELGSGTIVGPQVHLTGRTVVGKNNRFFTGCVIGEAPQDLRYRDEPTGVRVGDGNVFREHVTVHRSNKTTEDTVIGSSNYFMANAHIGHNSVVGDHVIMANGCLLGGHVQIHDRAFISGNCLVHQFVRVGTLAMMQGGSAVSKDLPPFTIVREVNVLTGLNTVGLRRAGYPANERLELRKLYHALFRSRLRFKEALEEASTQYSLPASVVMLDFVRSTKRGCCSPAGRQGSVENSEDSEG